MNVRIASPSGYSPNPAIVAQARQLMGDRGEVVIALSPIAAVESGPGDYTDVWASMGQESMADQRIPLFQPYQVNQGLLQQASPEVIVLHCLPAHRGEEITAEVMEGPASRVWDQAEIGCMPRKLCWLVFWPKVFWPKSIRIVTRDLGKSGRLWRDPWDIEFHN
jgi:ornithine carbamoyltransferase